MYTLNHLAKTNIYIRFIKKPTCFCFLFIWKIDFVNVHLPYICPKSLNCILILCTLCTAPRSTRHQVYGTSEVGPISVLVQVVMFLSTAWFATHLGQLNNVLYWAAFLLADKSSDNKFYNKCIIFIIYSDILKLFLYQF